MLYSRKSPVLKCPKQAERSLQLAVYLFPVWGLCWVVAWFSVERLTINGPIIQVLFARNVIGFMLASLPIILGIQGLIELKRHPGYSTGYLRALLGISVGAGFFIVEVISLFLTVALMIQKGLMT